MRNVQVPVGAAFLDLFVRQLLVHGPVAAKVLDELLDGSVMAEEVVLHVFAPQLEVLRRDFFHLASPDSPDVSRVSSTILALAKVSCGHLFGCKRHLHLLKLFGHHVEGVRGLPCCDCGSAFEFPARVQRGPVGEIKSIAPDPQRCLSLTCILLSMLSNVSDFSTSNVIVLPDNVFTMVVESVQNV